MKMKLLKKLSKSLMALSLAFTCCFAYQQNVLAYGDISTFGNVDGGGDVGPSVVINGGKNYSNSTTATKTFTVTSNSQYTSYILMNISVTNGKIIDTITGNVLIESATGSTSQKIIKKYGVTLSCRFIPHNSNVAGYNIIDVGAYY